MDRREEAQSGQFNNESILDRAVMISSRYPRWPDGVMEVPRGWRLGLRDTAATW